MGLIHEKKQGPKIVCYCTFKVMHGLLQKVHANWLYLGLKKYQNNGVFKMICIKVTSPSPFDSDHTNITPLRMAQPYCV
jgi:hypothetical protein